MLYNTKNPHGGDIYAGKVLLDFSANTAPFGTPQAVQEAIIEALPQLHCYPDPYCRKLVAAIAEHEAVPKNYILCGNGAADLIYAYGRAVHPKKAAMLAPTFSEYAQGLSDCKISYYFLQESKDFSLDSGILDFLRREKPEVLFLCDPNNPTGQLTDPDLMEAILERCHDLGIRLFLDECFLDLTKDGVSRKNDLARYPGLFLLKAFTKSYGMAGVRLGYGLSADTALLEAMSRSQQPWNISSLAQAAGIAALKQQGFLQKTIETVEKERIFLSASLARLGFRIIPSDTNYILFQAGVGLADALREKGILIRNCDNYPGLCPGWYRIAVRLPEENQALIRAMEEV